YHAPPAGSEPVVIPLDLEDAPTTPPPSTAQAKAQVSQDAPARAAAAERPARRPSRSVRPIREEGCDASYREAVDALSRASRHEAEREALAAADAGPIEAAPAQRPARRRPSARRPARDPIGNSFVPTTSRSTLPSTYTGGRSYY